MTAGHAISLVASYLLGAIPTSYIVGRIFRGFDLREHGSRNLGATNLYRVMGWKFAVPVGLFDVAKGVVPVAVLGPLVSTSRYFALACGLTAVLGHVFSAFVRFKGGKGVATAAGVVLALSPAAIGAALLLWAVIVFSTGYVSLGSITAAAALPLLVYFLEPRSRDLIWIDAVLAAGIIWLHRANIRRLLSGTENRFGRRRTTAPPA